MTPKEKAEELFNKMLKNTLESHYYAKQCALVAVDEIIKLDIFDCNDEWSDEDEDTKEYWQQVKQQIEKL